MNNIFNIVKTIAKKHNTKLDLNESDLNASLKSLGVDSLEAMGIIVETEKELNVRLDEESLMNMKTLGDLVKAFEKLTK